MAARGRSWSCVDIRHQLIRRRIWTVARKLDSVFDLRFDALLQVSDLVGRQQTAIERDLLYLFDRILLAPALDFLLLAIVERVAGVMAVEAIRVAHQVAWPVATAGPLDQLAGILKDAEEVHAVDTDAWDPIAGGAARRVATGDAPVRTRRHGVLVVLADVHHRQLPDRGQVRGLVQDALLQCAVAEETDRYRAGLLQLRSERGAGRQAHAAA